MYIRRKLVVKNTRILNIKKSFYALLDPGFYAKAIREH